MEKQPRWITQTKKALELHKKNNWPMDYVIPLEEKGKCGTCGGKLVIGEEYLHRMDEDAVVKIYDEADCFWRSFRGK